MSRLAPRTLDDGRSRPFGGSTARDVIARTLAERDGWGEIRQSHWAAAGALVKVLRAEGFPLRRTLARRKGAGEKEQVTS